MFECEKRRKLEALGGWEARLHTKTTNRERRRRSFVLVFAFFFFNSK